MSVELAQAIRRLRPEVESFAVRDGEIVEWPDGVSKPSQQEIDDMVAELSTPPTPALSKRQVNAALIIVGHTDPDALIEGAIATITDPTQKALAINDWRTAPRFDRGHPLLNDPDILSAAGFTKEQVDDLWALAATLPQ